jgi:hypothetical protein
MTAKSSFEELRELEEKRKEEKRKENLAKEIEAEFVKRRLAKRELVGSWLLNEAFANGKQFIKSNKVGDLIEQPKQKVLEERNVYNHIAPIVEMRLAKLSKKLKLSNLVLESDDEKKGERLDLINGILDKIYDKQNIKKTFIDGAGIAEIYGTVFYKIVWNNTLGAKVAVDTENIAVHLGDVQIAVISPLEIYPDSLTRANLDEVASLMHAKNYTVSEIENLFGVRVDADLKKEVTLIESYEKPNSEFKNGRLLIVAGGKLLFEGDLPYFPFVMQRCIANAGEFFGKTIVERCIPVQRAYNAVRNRKHEFMARFANGILTVEDESVDIDDLEEDGLTPGKVIVYRKGAKAPELLTPEKLPIDFASEEEKLINEFMLISGVSNFMRSAQTNNSGVALTLISGQDEDRILNSVNEQEAAAMEIAKQIVKLYASFAKIKRTINLKNKKQVLFDGNDIFLDDDFTFISKQIENLDDKQIAILELLKAGVLNDNAGNLEEEFKQRILKLFQIR